MGSARGMTDVRYCIFGRGERARFRDIAELPPNVLKKRTEKEGKKENILVQQEVCNMERPIMVGDLKCHQNPPELDVEGTLPPD